MKWSQLKKQIEGRLADSVRKRVTFGSTAYRKAHDELGRAWICIDGHEILNMGSIDFEVELYSRYRNGERNTDAVETELHGQNLFAQWHLHRSLFQYLNLSITEILSSRDPLIRAFGMLDARLGKRRLASIDINNEHDLVKRLYTLRCEAEGLPGATESSGPSDLTARILSASDLRRRRPKTKEVVQRAAAKLATADRTRNLRGMIYRIFNKEIPKDELDTDIAREIFAGFELTADRESLLKTLLFVESCSKLLLAPGHARGVIALTRNASNWLRPVDEWTPESHNPHRQFSSLARHLWARYPVPLFMDNAWITGSDRQQSWFRHLGTGGNIRTADDLPVALTKKMAHYFADAPQHYSIEAAFRWGQVHALGGDSRLADVLCETRLIRNFEDDAFWQSVLRFFVKNPMLDLVHVNPIIDYIWNQRYEPRVVFVEQGVAEQAGPEQPGFSMRGRTAEALLREVEAWHTRLGRETKGGLLQWMKSGTHEYTFVEGTKESKNMKVWRIHELLSSQELIAEGRQMRHCVASYAGSCHNGANSIWSMDVETEAGIEKLLTIQVVNSKKSISQVRGRLNRYPAAKEKEVLQRWALREGLEIATYI